MTTIEERLTAGRGLFSCMLYHVIFFFFQDNVASSLNLAYASVLILLLLSILIHQLILNLIARGKRGHPSHQKKNTYHLRV